MSTKIYNGYKMKKLNAVEMFHFVSELKEILYDFFNKQYIKLFQEECEKMIDSLSYSDFKKDFETIDKLLLSYEKAYRNDAKTIVHNIDNDRVFSIETTRKNMLGEYSRIGFKIREIIRSKASLSEVNHTIMNDDYYFCAEMVLFPIFRGYTLFLAYSDSFSRLLDTMISNKENNPIYTDFITKYGIEDYHYQNQTDKPDNISDYRWNKRSDDWDKYFEISSIPSVAGISIELMDSDMFFLKHLTSDKKLDLVFTSKEDRIKKMAKQKVLDEYYIEYKNKSNSEESAYRIFLNAERAFREELKNENSEVNLRIKEKEKELENIIIDIDKKIIGNNIRSLIPNYTSEYDEENTENKEEKTNELFD